MTPVAIATLQFLHDHHANNGYWPSLSEMAEEFGISKVSIFERIGNLVACGALRKISDRTCRNEYRILIPIPRPRLRFPVVGTISRKGIERKGFA